MRCEDGRCTAIVKSVEMIHQRIEPICIDHERKIDSCYQASHQINGFRIFIKPRAECDNIAGSHKFLDYFLTGTCKSAVRSRGDGRAHYFDGQRCQLGL